jgi:hypothetical protein
MKHFRTRCECERLEPFFGVGRNEFVDNRSLANRSQQELRGLAWELIGEPNEQPGFR